MNDLEFRWKEVFKPIFPVIMVRLMCLELNEPCQPEIRIVEMDDGRCKRVVGVSAAMIKHKIVGIVASGGRNGLQDLAAESIEHFIDICSKLCKSDFLHCWHHLLLRFQIITFIKIWCKIINNHSWKCDIDSGIFRVRGGW